MTNTYELTSNQELRFNVGVETILLELRRGLAEVYGTEMLANKTYTFPRNSKAAVFTYHGATLEMTGSPQKCHVGSKCDYMTYYLNIHGHMEVMRNELLLLPEDSNGNLSPPICLVCKPMYARNVGKSTLCRILLNYATRRGRAPIFVDLDPDQNHIGLPGSIGALSIESPIDIETGLSLRSSMLMHFGHTSTSSDNEILYRKLVENMAKIVHSKLEQDKKSFQSGVIINTTYWSDDAGYKLLVHACKSFKANMVLVMDDEVLHDDLKKDLADCPHSVSVLNVPKTVGIITSAPEKEIELRYNRIKKYFYGTPNEPYNPMTSEMKFSYLKRLIYKIGVPIMLPDSLMPLGSKAQDSQVKVSPHDCTGSDLLHHILAISYCKIDDVVEDPESILRTNIMGFICITSVIAEGDIVRILTPQKLPSPLEYVLLYSDVQYMDS